MNQEKQTNQLNAMPCCGYLLADAIKFNPFNKVVQCHNCGQVYSPQIKELSDEEIKEVIRKHWNKELGNRGMLALCKAILKKASETCNGFCGEQECRENQDSCKRVKKASEK